MNEVLSKVVLSIDEAGSGPSWRNAPPLLGLKASGDGRSRQRSRRAADVRPSCPDEGSPSPIELAALETLDKLNRGVALLDDDGCVLFANRAAQAMARRRDGVSIRNQRLSFVDSNASTVFLEWCQGYQSSLVLRVPRADRGREGYRVLVSRLIPKGAVAAICVFIYEPLGGQRALSMQVLRGLYGLTPAEARLVNALFAGRSFGDAAKTLGISLNTAKSALKRVFAKCEVSTQAELLQLLSLGPRTL